MTAYDCKQNEVSMFMTGWMKSHQGKVWFPLVYGALVQKENFNVMNTLQGVSSLCGVGFAKRAKYPQMVVLLFVEPPHKECFHF